MMGQNAIYFLGNTRQHNLCLGNTTLYPQLELLNVNSTSQRFIVFIPNFLNVV